MGAAGTLDEPSSDAAALGVDGEVGSLSKLGRRARRHRRRSGSNELRLTVRRRRLGGRCSPRKIRTVTTTKVDRVPFRRARKPGGRFRQTVFQRGGLRLRHGAVGEVVGDRGDGFGVSGAIFALEGFAAGDGVEDVGVGVALGLGEVAQEEVVGGAEVLVRGCAQDTEAPIDLGLEALLEFRRLAFPSLEAGVQGEQRIGGKALDGGAPILSLEGAHDHADGDIG